MWIVIPVLFSLTYAITWALGLGTPDWQIRQLWDVVAKTGADMTTAPSPSMVVLALFASSLFAGPFINSLLGFGEEWGWRGYLLPHLIPLGKVKAYLLIGVIWGLWHAPLIVTGFGYSNQNPILSVIMFIGMTTALGITMNELTLHYRSSILAGWIHGLFNCQAYGIWRIVFYDYNPLFGGYTGIIGLTLLTLMGFATIWILNRKPAMKAEPAVS
jgi:uncharacterized protein